jgi:thiaminase (transcriptional activator TenA)
MSFSEHLRREADTVFQAIRQHPFVQGLAHQNLSRETLIHYVKQDVQYLKTYAKVYGLALAKSQTIEQMKFFHERIGVVLDGEALPHQNLCRAADVQYEDLKTHATHLAPTAHHYAHQMLATAYAGTLGEILAALLPCHWVYVDAAEYLLREYRPTPEHLFYDWISFYASDPMQTSLQDFLRLLDAYAEHAGTDELERMKAAFLAGCHLEYRFFDMAYTLEDWALPVTQSQSRK